MSERKRRRDDDDRDDRGSTERWKAVQMSNSVTVRSGTLPERDEPVGKLMISGGPERPRSAHTISEPEGNPIDVRFGEPNQPDT